MNMSSTRILATLGPASSDYDTILRLAKAGANAFRMNFSHGSHQDHAKRYALIRKAEEELGHPIGVLADLQGPKLRIGTIAKGTVLETGASFIFDTDDARGTTERVCLPHPEIFREILPGHRMLVDDGRLQFTVTGVDHGKIITRVDIGGAISDRKGVNVPDINLEISPLTEKDRADLAFALDLGVDWVALSFVQRVSDLIEARSLIGDRAALMAKIEKPAAVAIMEDLITAADGIMIARGDLGVELQPEQVPGVQKDITRLCRRVGKPVVVATQMLESMINNPTPTRAEASDVATAVMDGVDSLMLSAETAAGSWPVESVTIMMRILGETESRSGYIESLSLSGLDTHTTFHAVAGSATQLAHNIGAAAIIAFTTSGATAVRLSRERPGLPIIMMSSRLQVRRRMTLLWGVSSIETPDFSSFDTAFEEISRLVLAAGICQPSDQVVVVAGTPFGVIGTTNTIRVLSLQN